MRVLLPPLLSQDSTEGSVEAIKGRCAGRILAPGPQPSRWSTHGRRARCCCLACGSMQKEFTCTLPSIAPRRARVKEDHAPFALPDHRFRVLQTNRDGMAIVAFLGPPGGLRRSHGLGEMVWSGRSRIAVFCYYGVICWRAGADICFPIFRLLNFARDAMINNPLS